MNFIVQIELNSVNNHFGFFHVKIIFKWWTWLSFQGYFKKESIKASDENSYMPFLRNEYRTFSRTFLRWYNLVQQLILMIKRSLLGSIQTWGWRWCHFERYGLLLVKNWLIVNLWFILYHGIRHKNLSFEPLASSKIITVPIPSFVGSRKEEKIIVVLKSILCYKNTMSWNQTQYFKQDFHRWIKSNEQLRLFYRRASGQVRK